MQQSLQAIFHYHSIKMPNLGIAVKTYQQRHPPANPGTPNEPEERMMLPEKAPCASTNTLSYQLWCSHAAFLAAVFTRTSPFKSLAFPHPVSVVICLKSCLVLDCLEAIGLLCFSVQFLSSVGVRKMASNESEVSDLSSKEPQPVSTSTTSSVHSPIYLMHCLETF